MASVEWTVGARENLREIVEFIAHDSPTYAASVAARITSATRRLREYPKIGRMIPEYDLDELRELIILSYRVAYRVDENRSVILAITHGRRDLRPFLGDDPTGVPKP